ncbi:unnamed protein product [Staurois parvus]|uniref:Uncharacterized protein n=1 Tax=Staurois parvus TaxID=386267 RepID=A0ABN9D0E0_9NEOB|nr:unnamed protein product [Staurois parvus]
METHSMKLFTHCCSANLTYRKRLTSLRIVVVLIWSLAIDSADSW